MSANEKEPLAHSARLSVAPMMDWTDRHCRYLHRLFSQRALLYTEMVTAPALVRGGALHLLEHAPEENPLALQLGGSDPVELAEAARLGAAAGYGEINLNCGCPSDRVQSGTFGAVLMRDASRVADCIKAMQDASNAEITVKCRIGVDEQEPYDILPYFIETLAEAGLERIIIHARKAWLQGLSPKDNREIPPLDYGLVLKMKQAFPQLHISINGGVSSLDAARDLLAQGIDGVMIGRAAYHRPADILSSADREIFGEGDLQGADEVVMRMLSYIDRHLSCGGSLHQVTRHMLGIFAGQPGARQWRRILSEGATKAGAGPALVEKAYAAVCDARQSAS